MYGGGAKALYEMLLLYKVDLNDSKILKDNKCKNGVEVAQKYIDRYFETYSGVATFMKNQKKFAKRNGYVNTLVGRKRRLHNINSTDFKIASYEERLALNSPIQGSAGDITMNAQIRIEQDETLKSLFRCSMLIQIHDELVYQCPEEYVNEVIPKLQHYMNNPFGDHVKLNLPLTTSANSGNSYQEAK